MNLSNPLAITLAVLTAAGLLTWAGLAVIQVMDELRTFDSFEGMHFEEWVASSRHNRDHRMSNPWLKKNPVLSMWLTGANRIAGTIRSQATAQARRQVNAATTDAARANRSIWFALLTPTSSKARKKRKR